MLHIIDQIKLIGSTELHIDEDLILGHLAKERFEKSTRKDYISGEVVAKRLGLIREPLKNVLSTAL